MSCLNAGINGGIPSRGSYDEDNLDEEEAIERQVSAAFFYTAWIVCLRHFVM